MNAEAFPALLLDALVRSSLILFPVVLFSRYARRASAATRHLACLAGLAAVIALPLLTLSAPRLHLGLVAAESGPVAPAAPAAAEPIAAEPIAAAGVAHEASVPAVALPISPTGGSGPSATVLLLGIWALVAGLLSVRVLRDQASVFTLCRQGRPVGEREVLRRFESAAAEIGIERVPPLRAHPEVEMPVTWGLFRSTVLLPDGASSWSASRLRAVFLHELSHVKRRDCLTQMIADLVCAAFWFQPLAWLTARRMREEREAACDDPVILRGARPSGYATLLLRMLATLRSRGIISASSAAFGQGSGLERRLRSVLGRERSRRAPSIGMVAAFLAGGLTVALFMAALSPESAPESAKAPSRIAAADAPVDAYPAPEAAPGVPAVSAETDLDPMLDMALGLVEGMDPATGRILTDEATVKKVMSFAAELLRAKGPTGGDRPDILLDFLEAASRGDWEIKEGGPRVLRLNDPELLAKLRVSGCVEFETTAEGSTGEIAVPRLPPGRGRTIRIAETIRVKLEGPGGLPIGSRRPEPGEELPRGRNTLFSREIHDDTVRSTLSFGYATRDDKQATNNSWDLWLKGRADPFTFAVGRVGGEEACRIVELGPEPLEAVTTASAEGRILSQRARVRQGHSYLAYTKGRGRDYWTRFRVDKVNADGSVTITWEVIEAALLPRR